MARKARAGARKSGPKVEEIAAVERRKAFPRPLFPGDPGNKLRHTTQGAPFGVPPPSLLQRASSPKTPTHVKRFAGSDDAWPEGGAMLAKHAHLSSPGSTGRPSIPGCLRYASVRPGCALEYWVPACAGMTSGVRRDDGIMRGSSPRMTKKRKGNT